MLCNLVGNHMYFYAIQVHVTDKIALDFALCNYLTVTGPIDIDS